jgi:hypothetical protein
MKKTRTRKRKRKSEAFQSPLPVRAVPSRHIDTLFLAHHFPKKLMNAVDIHARKSFSRGQASDGSCIDD